MISPKSLALTMLALIIFTSFKNALPTLLQTIVNVAIWNFIAGTTAALAMGARF